MFPRNGVSTIAASHLNLQRRMHPQIANLMRETLYPYLLVCKMINSSIRFAYNCQDHPSTKARAPVPGMVDRIWWLSHLQLEDVSDGRSATPNSSSNAFEVEMVAGLVEYLVSSNEYDYKDITVLTPYNGQLAAFNDRFRSICSLWLSEKDREALIMEVSAEQELLSFYSSELRVEFSDSTPTAWLPQCFLI